MTSALFAPGSNSIVVTVLVAIATAFCIVVPRVAPLVVIAITMIAAVLLLVREGRERGWQSALSGTLLRPEMPFIIWVFVACLWASLPASGLLKSAFLAGIVIHAIIISRHLGDLRQGDVEAIGKGLLIGFLVGGAYLVMEITLRDYVGRFVLTYLPDLDRGLAKHSTMKNGVVTRVSGAHITRVAVVFALLLFPAFLAARRFLTGTWQKVAYGLIAAFVLVVVVHPHSHSQTAQLALVAGLVFAAVAYFWPRFGTWAAGASFAGALFLIIPLSLGMYAAGLHENEDLFTSARARVIIWNYTSERILERPILGVGTNSTRYLDEQRPKVVAPEAKKLIVEAQTRAHPHNVYLQVWYELGLIGALLFALLGLSLLWRIDQLPQDRTFFAIGHFAISMTVIASTYGLWQNWFQSIIVLSILALLVLARSPDASAEPAVA